MTRSCGLRPEWNSYCVVSMPKLQTIHICCLNKPHTIYVKIKEFFVIIVLYDIFKDSCRYRERGRIYYNARDYYCITYSVTTRSLIFFLPSPLPGITKWANRLMVALRYCLVFSARDWNFLFSSFIILCTVYVIVGVK